MCVCTYVQYVCTYGMSARTVCPHVWHVRLYGMSARMVCPHIWYVRLYGMSARMVCPPVRYVLMYSMSACMVSPHLRMSVCTYGRPCIHPPVRMYVYTSIRPSYICSYICQVGQPFASPLVNQQFASQGCTNSQWNWFR
jgi:hypothetical protein